MPNYLKNFGLGEFDQEARLGIMAYVTREGKAINGYWNCPSFLKTMGSIDLYIRTRRTEAGTLEVYTLDTHSSGHKIWDLCISKVNINPKDAEATEKLLMVGSSAEGSFVPMHVLNPDVLPSVLEGDRVLLQVVGLPLTIGYYADEDAYADSQPETEKGKKWLLGDGALLPLMFLENHSLDKDPEKTDFSTDDIVHFRGTVKKLSAGMFCFEDDPTPSYIRCVIDTNFGELELCHTIDQVPEECRQSIREGAVVYGICVLSGDAAIFQYENGFIRDWENDCDVFRQAFYDGQAQRLRSILKENSRYISDAMAETYTGADAIIDRFQKVFEANGACCAQWATITEGDTPDLPHMPGTRCLVLSYQPDKYENIVFLDVDDDGYVESLHICTDSRYRFAVDQTEQE